MLRFHLTAAFDDDDSADSGGDLLKRESGTSQRVCACSPVLSVLLILIIQCYVYS